jgi:hypothetical protein
MLKGGLQINDCSVPIRCHFLTELLKATHLELDTKGIFVPRLIRDGRAGRWNCKLLKDAFLTAEAACRVWRPHFLFERDARRVSDFIAPSGIRAPSSEKPPPTNSVGLLIASRIHCSLQLTQSY